MFLNFLGFSIIIPILPFLVERFTRSSTEIALYVGLLLSAYAFCQFLASPSLGALADRFGRRPVLLASLLGSVVGYLLLGFGASLPILFLGRIVDGLTGGNISTVYAYVADITEPKNRGRVFGLLGAAGGFGFMIGPALGGFLSNISIVTPLFVAAAVTLVNFLWGYLVLPESLSPEHATAEINLAHLNPIAQFNHILNHSLLSKLFIAAFIFFFALNAMYGNNSVFSKDVLGWTASQIGLLLFVVGILDIISQGFLVRQLLPLLGEAKLVIIGVFLAALGFAISLLTIFTVSPLVLYLGVILLNIGDGLFEPSASGLISTAVGPREQGRVQGAYQGLQSVARVLGPLFSAYVYRFWRGLPFLGEAFLALMSFFFLFSLLPRLRAHQTAVHEN